MQLSSLTSIISTVLSTFNSESEKDLNAMKAPEYSLYHYDYFDQYLSFYQNQGVAELCTSTIKGYINFAFQENNDYFYPAIPNDNYNYLDVIESAQSGIFQIVIGGSSPGRLSFPYANNTRNGKISGVGNPSIDEVPYMFFFDSNPIRHGAFNCFPLWIANNNGFSHGWSTAELVYKEN